MYSNSMFDVHDFSWIKEQNTIKEQNFNKTDDFGVEDDRNPKLHVNNECYDFECKL